MLNKHLLADDPAKLGAFVFSRDPTMTEVYAASGFDFVIVDMEHGLNDVATAVAHVTAARGAGVTALIRMGGANLLDVPRLLDAGCEGIMFPHFGLPGSGAAEALRSLRFHPEGNRPTCTGVPAAAFGLGNFAEASAKANRSIISVGLIEDRESVENIEAILDGPGTDWLMPGPGDLATAYGVHGQLRHPTVEAAIDTVFRAAMTRRRVVGMYVNDPAEVAAWYAKGARFFVLSIDFKWLAKSLLAAAAECRQGCVPAQLVGQHAMA